MLNSKELFPIFEKQPNLRYFDSASTSQTPKPVLDAMHRYYTEFRANTGRGEYVLTDTATHAVSVARSQVAELINVNPEHLLFTAGTTDSLNRIANWCKSYDTIVITEAEHNANIIPWIIQGRTVDNGRLVVLPIDDHTGYVDLENMESVLSKIDGAGLLSFCATSNVTGVTQPWQAMTNIAHQYGFGVAIDFCQTVAHEKIDLTTCPIEWACFSAHKMYGPTGVGVLYTPFDLDELVPQTFGGGAVNHVSFHDVDFATGTLKHEPGTPNIAGIIGMGTAAELINYVGYSNIHEWEDTVVINLLSYGFDDLPNCKLYCHTSAAADSPRSIFSFVPTVGHSHDVAVQLAHSGVAVRTGKVCAHPLVNRIAYQKGIVRVSIAPYNDIDDCRELVSHLRSALLKLA